MTAADTAPQWRVDRTQDLLWADLDEGAAVYHRPSGKTHFLNSSSVALLKRLQAGPADSLELALAITGGDAADLPPTFVDQVSVMLRHFDYLGLIRRSPP